MLQDIRSNVQGTMAKIIIGLIVISFSIFGIESLLFSGGSNAAIEINGEEISPLVVQQEVSLLQRQLLSMLGENADPALLDQDMLSEEALQSIIRRTLLAQAAQDLRLSVSDEIIGNIIGSMEDFRVGGEFSVDLFRSRLASAGYTPAFFRQRLSEDILQSQLRSGLAGSAFVTQDELESASRVAAEGRDLRYLTLPLEDFRSNATIGEAEIGSYYEDNAAQFMSEEELRIEYLELQQDDYLEAVDEERVREEFELVRDEFELAGDSRVSHILFEGSADERATRLAEAQAAVESGKAFEDVAREMSDDIGSAAAGGDLGYTAGDTFPEPMEEAIAALDVGQTGSVETDAGTHLLLVTDRRAGSAVEFADVRGELEQRLQDRDASAALLRDVERLRDLAFNAADLDGPAAELELTVQEQTGVTRTTTSGLLAEPRLQQAAFAEDVLEAGHNSEVIELSPERFVALRVAERIAPQQQPLASVRGDIERTLRQEQALKDARQRAASMLQELEEGTATVEQLANSGGFEWQVELGARRDSTRLPEALRRRVFSLVAPGADGPVRDTVQGNDTLYLLELTRVTPGSIDGLSVADRQALRQRLASENASALLQQYEASLRARANIEVY